MHVVYPVPMTDSADSGDAWVLSKTSSAPLAFLPDLHFTLLHDYNDSVLQRLRRLGAGAVALVARLGTRRPLVFLVGLGVSRPSAVHGVGGLLELLLQQVRVDPVALSLGSEELLLALLSLAQLPLLDLVQLALALFLVLTALVNVRGWMSAGNGRWTDRQQSCCGHRRSRPARPLPRCSRSRA